MVCAVIDTNVLVSSLLSRHPDSGTVVIRDFVLSGKVIPLYNDVIIQEYVEGDVAVILGGTRRAVGIAHRSSDGK